MCGLIGVINKKIDKNRSAKIFQLLSHRGPDDKGQVSFPEGFLAHTRLSIIDLTPAGHQPMQSYDGDLQIVFNGEIYNYKELKRELKKDYHFRTDSDTEVILAAYQKWGEKCLGKLRGMFAFGIWDKKRKTLFCATDRFSIKQLYYYHNKEVFAICSEIKPLAEIGIKFLANDRAIFDFLSFGLQDHSEETFFKGIFQLRPAHYLLFKNGQLKISRYWDIEEGDSKDTEKIIQEKAEEKLREAVKYHLVSDVETGLSLSSGLDSNLLRGIINSSEKLSKLKCFTHSFVNTPYEEGKYVSSLKDKKSEFYITPIKSADFFDNYSKLIKIIEEPVSGLGTYGYWFNCKTAKEKGIKVLLDGQGGDEMFGGYDYYQNKELITKKASDGTSIENCDYLSGDFFKKFKGREVKPVKKFKSPFRNAAYNDLMFFKIPKLLRFQDKTSMSQSIETRVPFLDHTLCELVFSLPPAILLKNGVKKYLLRSIAKNYLEKTAINKTKLFVSTPQREWIKQDLRKEIEGMIKDSLICDKGYIDSKKLILDYQNYINQKDLGNSFFIWKFFSLELWFRNFIYGK